MHSLNVESSTFSRANANWWNYVINLLLHHRQRRRRRAGWSECATLWNLRWEGRCYANRRKKKTHRAWRESYVRILRTIASCSRRRRPWIGLGLERNCIEHGADCTRKLLISQTRLRVQPKAVCSSAKGPSAAEKTKQTELELEKSAAQVGGAMGLIKFWGSCEVWRSSI